MKQKYFNLLSWITLGLLSVLLSIIGYYLFYPYNPLEIQEPVKVITKEVKPGDIIFVEFTFKKNTTVRPEISLALVDGVVFNIPDYSPINPTGETKDKRVGVLVVPTSVPCGEYNLKWVASYKMNPLRIVDVPYESEKFYINSKICY